MENIYRSKVFGFTILEILIVLFTISLLAVIGYSTFVAFGNKSSVDKGAALLVGLLNDARSRTLSSIDDSQYGVHFEEFQVVLFKGNTYSSSDPDNEVTTLDGAIRISTISISGGSDVVFDRLTGKTDNTGTVRVALRNDALETKTVTILATGISEHN